MKTLWSSFLLLTLAAYLGRGAGSGEPRMIPGFAGRCRRSPPHVSQPRSQGDNQFRVRISGNPTKYQPGEIYTVSLSGESSLYMTQKFIGFMLIVEPKEIRNDISARPDVGSFQLYGDAVAKFSDECPNAIVHASLIPKQSVQVKWRAPPTGTGCILFKATVQESRELWYMDEGKLIRELCEEEQENQDEQPEVLNECEACDEAKYELVFEGIWSRHTHPKDYPTNEWQTLFSELVGASHAGGFRMWEYGQEASPGVKEVAEMGSTRAIEAELKTQSHQIRTIIKARPLTHPQVQGRTFALFRVDRRHHLVSLLSKLAPSPDWVVGVSALELCLRNGSWAAERALNLYPLDAGTDSGTTYESSRSPTIPAERIRKITSAVPNSGPFYDSQGQPMKPVARLTVTRQRVYDKSCDDYEHTTQAPSDDGTTVTPACAVSEWSEFSECSQSCGEGFRLRTRYYLKGDYAAAIVKCEDVLTETETCAHQCIGEVSCRLSGWGEWSECSVTCGKGVRMRARTFLDARAQRVCGMPLVEKEVCYATQARCETEIEPRPLDPKCGVTHWSEWSPCGVTCGRGMTVRKRMYLSADAHSHCAGVDLFQKAPCSADREDCALNLEEARKNCLEPKEVGPCRGYYPRWHFDAGRKVCAQFIYGGCRGNKNNFERYADCSRVCEAAVAGNALGSVTSPATQGFNSSYSTSSFTTPLPPQFYKTKRPTATPSSSGNNRSPVAPEGSDPGGPAPSPDDSHRSDCVVSEWGEWSPCSETCGDSSRRERVRHIQVPPRGGGRPCPDKLVVRRRCKESPPCPDGMNDETATDCVLRAWSSWSACSRSCGAAHSGTQQRTRAPLQEPRGAGRPCAPRLERRYCDPLPPCPA